jgi:competence protein ComEC
MSLGERVSLVVIGGVAVGLITLCSVGFGLAVATAAGACALALGPPWTTLRPVLLWIGLAGVALAGGAHTRNAALADSPFAMQARVSADDPPFVVTGRLRRDASVGESGVRLDLEVEGSRVMVTVGGVLATSLMPDWTAGRVVRLPARLREPPVIRNPGSPSVRWQRLTRPIDLVGTVKSGSLVEVTPAGGWADAAAAVRRYVRTVTARWLAPHDAQTAAVVTAILIGDRAGLDPEVTRRLQVAGTFHVIAISGGNVAILTAMCLLLLQWVMRGERVPTVITLLVVLAYGAVVGSEPSVARAVVAAALYLGLRLIGLVPRATSVLALTGLICVVANPLVVLEVGAWLSFGATFGLIVVLPRLLGDPDRRAATMVTMARGLLMATVAAEIVILPIAAAVFMRVGVAGLLLNFVAIPAMTIVQLSGLALCGLAPLWGGGASVVAAASQWSTTALVGSASLVDVAPWLSWRVPPPSQGVVLVYYLALLLALGWRGRRVVRRGAVGVAACCACVICLAPTLGMPRPAPGWMRVTVLDVGQGDAIVVQAPDGHVILVDAGGSIGRFDVGGRIVTPALWGLGVRRLDWLALTHGDLDHVGGARRVMEDMRPLEVWEGVPVLLHPATLDLRRLAHDRHMPWRRLQAGHQLELGGLMVDVLHPPVPDWQRPKVRNDDSVVLRLRMGRVEVLLTGDVGAEFESTYRPDGAEPPIRILKLAHHGSRTSSSEQFIDTYRPAAAVVSAGQDNLFGHPSPVVLARFDHRNIDVFRTDRHGAIVIETDGRSAYVSSASGRGLLLAADVSRAARRPPSRP